MLSRHHVRHRRHPPADRVGRPPVNVIARPGGPTVADLAAAGVACVSVGGGFALLPTAPRSTRRATCSSAGPTAGIRAGVASRPCAPRSDADPRPGIGSPHGRHPVAGRRLLARRRVPSRRAIAGGGARSDAGRHRGIRPELRSPTSTPSGPRGRGRRPTSRSPSAACPRASRSSSRSRAGRSPRRRSSSRTAWPTTPSTTSSACSTRGGVVPVGADDRQRVRRAQRERHQDQRRHPQPVAPRPHRAAARPAARRAAVAGGLVSLATGGDGGGSIRIPAGYTRPARHEGHLRPHPPQPARVHASEHRRARQPRPLGPRRGPLLRRLRRRSPVRPDQPALAGRLGGGARHARPGGQAGSRSSPTSAASRSSPGVEDRIRGRGQGAHRRHRHGRGRPARRACPTSPRSG